MELMTQSAANQGCINWTPCILSYLRTADRAPVFAFLFVLDVAMALVSIAGFILHLSAPHQVLYPAAA